MIIILSVKIASIGIVTMLMISIPWVNGKLALSISKIQTKVMNVNIFSALLGGR